MLGLWECWLRSRQPGAVAEDGERCIWLLADVPAPESMLALEETLRKTDESVTLLGWRCPERNLDFPAWLLFRACLMCCREPLRSYCRIFLRRGGIEGVVARCGRRVSARAPLLGGAATRIRLAKKDGPG